MGSSVAGDPLWAVLIQPQLGRFQTLVGIDSSALDVDFTGWNKYVILDRERAFLFPRRANNVEWLERELAAYRALQPIGLAVVPHLLGEWEDDSVYPFPFAAVSRLPGQHPADPSDLLDQLGRVIAQWHEITPPSLPGPARPNIMTEPTCGGSAALSTRRPHTMPLTRQPNALAVETGSHSGSSFSTPPPDFRMSWYMATSTRTSYLRLTATSPGYSIGRRPASTTPSGTSISGNGVPASGVDIEATSLTCGLVRGGPMHWSGDWTPMLPPWRQHSAFAKPYTFLTMNAIPMLSGPWTSISKQSDHELASRRPDPA